MTNTTLLKDSAIVRHASTGSAPPHGPVKTGDLSLVQVKRMPAAAPIREDQQARVEILPPRDAQSALITGGLPMVKVKMADGKPQADDGRGDGKVVIRNAQRTDAAGGLPMIQVKMDGGKPQVQTLPNIQGGPPQIQSAPPALSAPRNGRFAVPRQAVAPQRQLRQALPAVPELSTDQLMLCRHLVDTYLGALVVPATTEPATTEPPTELPPKSDVVIFAEATIVALDEVLIATAVRAAAAAEEEAAVAASASAPVARSFTTPTFAAATSISPVPAAAYVAGRVGGQRTQRNASMAPRRVSRPGAPLPTVIVNMAGERSVVQNQDVIDQSLADRGSMPGATPSPRPASTLPPVIVKMDGGRPLVQNRAEIAQAVRPSPEQVVVEVVTPTDASQV
jgi:hypothetical protein